jgi:DNA helicase II / ATP-dependent DNA helicase PcrA
MLRPTLKQEQIRDHEELDLIVVAPAGCGKTEALALRVAGLINRGAISLPRRVLVTTFSNRARDNIHDRLKSYLPTNLLRGRVTVSNFHGLSARIFRAHAAVIGLDPGMELPEDDWVRQECQSRGLSYAAIDAVEEVLRRLKLERVTDQQVEDSLAAAGERVALQIERKRRSEHRLTYDDLPRVADLILADDAVASLYCNHFGAVIVDEFQDLTPQQLRIVNRIGLAKTTYAGDLAQGIYGFTGAEPIHTDSQIRRECSTIVELNESHRSSPAVLGVVNSMASLTGSQVLQCADAASWPGGGLAGEVTFGGVDAEAQFAVNLARFVLSRAPHQRIGVLARIGSRRRFVDAAIELSDLEFHRWDDPILDTDTARAVKSLLGRLDPAEFDTATDPLAFMREQAQMDAVQDPTARSNLREALSWCVDLFHDGYSPLEVRSRIHVGDDKTLLSAPGAHLLTGHVGKGQQFDWVVIVGAEEGCSPFFKASTAAELAEEARIFSVMASRARHGIIVCNASNVPALSGQEWPKEPSRYLRELSKAGLADSKAIREWLYTVDWDLIAAR